MGNVFSDLISATCQAIFTPCLDCTSKKVAYIRELEDNVNSLQNELQELVEAKADVKTRVDFAEQRRQMQRLSQVQGWLSRVEAEETEVSYKFGKKVAKKLQYVVNLKNEGAFEVVAQEVPEPAVDLIPMQPTIVGLQSTFDKVWRCLIGEEVGIIAIYGTGGVGKTTLLKQINNKFCNELQGLFDESWKHKSLQEKAGDIFKILSSKKFVLLLDDIWNWINLTEVGVPISNSKSVSKVVFTTRSFEVCGSMKAHKPFKVEYLRDEDAWKLFVDNLQSDVLGSDPDIPQLAKDVAKECAGLPLALVTVGRAMSCKKTPQEWSYAANVLRNSASKFAANDIEKEKQNYLVEAGTGLTEAPEIGKWVEVLSITLGSYNALQRLMSSVKLQSCTQSLLLSGYHESTSFNISDLATLKHLYLLRIEEWKGFYIGNAGDVPKIREPSSFYSLHHLEISKCKSLRDLTWMVFISIPQVSFISNPFSETPSSSLILSTKNLKSIFGKALPFPRLKEILVVHCPKLKKLPLDSNSATEHNIVIKGNEIWWNELQWEDEATLNAFLPCFKSSWRCKMLLNVALEAVVCGANPVEGQGIDLQIFTTQTSWKHSLAIPTLAERKTGAREEVQNEERYEAVQNDQLDKRNACYITFNRREAKLQ
ncbi:hypothetical protein Pint_21271 [Pistacia integerrima]|uniref:Uncharacterized protein n=1 Tax=Pistacia integerrima TaxID=434235 RepID=A0ACC0X9I8_9ROSI|nr:hypothetical protein Pint_21271 [Pistacia integerrima]